MLSLRTISGSFRSIVKSRIIAAATASESVYINTDTPVVLDFGTASPQ